MVSMVPLRWLTGSECILLFQRMGVQIPGPMLGVSKPLITPVVGNQTSDTSDFSMGPVCTCTVLAPPR